MRRRITLGLFALALSVTGLIGAAHRAQAQVCPLCTIGNHCCLLGGNPICVPNSNPC